MKLSIQHTILPGIDLIERFQAAAEYGFDGIEICFGTWPGTLPGPISDYQAVVERILFTLPPVASEETLPRLENYAEVAKQFT
jgi:hypothetical protein